MPEQFLHGIEHIELTNGVRPISTVKSSVIGLIGTASAATAANFPLNTPVLITGSRTDAAKLGTEGTLPAAIDGIFDQCGAMVVVIRVADGIATPAQGSTPAITAEAATISNIIGGVDSATGKNTGVQCFLDANSVVKVRPRILIAPGFSHQQAVATELLAIAERLKAVCVLDGPNTTNEAAISYAENFGSARVYVVDPWVKVWDATTSADVVQPASARVAGLISKSDNERGFWWSPSNQEINGITGTARPIDFVMGDSNCKANYLNENNVATIIHQDGYRLWGNRTPATDTKFAFLCVRRTADMVAESLLYAHLWAVDRGITRTYVEDVRDGVDLYLRHLQVIGAILGGSCWVDKEINTSDQIMQGIVYWDYDFTPVYPAEHLVFRSHIVDGYIDEIFA